ncbi:hypothetical protein [Streptomyces sp. NPDC048516]|uniref:hypothetical protein n=1 Tax=Streptomyces sp. NPDC048516 TaxID=3365565 RepID=UPI00371CF014
MTFRYIPLTARHIRSLAAYGLDHTATRTAGPGLAHRTVTGSLKAGVTLMNVRKAGPP